MPNLLFLQRVNNYIIRTELRFGNTSCLRYRSIHRWWFSGKVVDFSHQLWCLRSPQKPVGEPSNCPHNSKNCINSDVRAANECYRDFAKTRLTLSFGSNRLRGQAPARFDWASVTGEACSIMFLRVCDGKPLSKLGHDGSSDRVGGARIGVSVPRKTPRRINFDEDVRYARIIENAAAQLLFRLRFMPKLQRDEKWRRPVCSSQFAGCTKHLLRYRDAAVDSRIGAVRHDQLRQ